MSQFSNYFRYRFSWKSACIALAIHTLLVFAFAVWLHFELLQHNSESLMAWIVFFWLDFPTGLLLQVTEGPVLDMFYNPSPSLCNVLMALQCAVLGGTQYFLLTGWLLGRSKASLTRDMATATANADEKTPLPPPDRDNPYSAPHAEPSEQT